MGSDDEHDWRKQVAALLALLAVRATLSDDAAVNAAPVGSNSALGFPPERKEKNRCSDLKRGT